MEFPHINMAHIPKDHPKIQYNCWSIHLMNYKCYYKDVIVLFFCKASSTVVCRSWEIFGKLWKNQRSPDCDLILGIESIQHMHLVSHHKFFLSFLQKDN